MSQGRRQKFARTFQKSSCKKRGVSLLFCGVFGPLNLGTPRPCTRVKIRKIRKRGFRGRKTHFPRPRRFESENPHFPTGHHREMGILWLKPPFSGVVGNGGFSTPKPSFPDFGDFDPCTLEINGITRTFNYFRINYPKSALTLTLTLFNFFKLDFLAGCNGKGVITIFVQIGFLAGCNGKGVMIIGLAHCALAILDYISAIHGHTPITLTVGTKIIADPEKCFQELISEKILVLLGDGPCLELIIVSSNFQALLSYRTNYWNQSDSD